MAKVQNGRYTATPPAGSVVFIIGMRINKLWKVHRWVPVVAAMPRMLRELARNRDLGLLGYRQFVSGRTITLIQYWRSVEDLNGYARARDREHLPAWRAFNRRVGTNGDVGIFHETIVVGDGGFEALYNNLPATMAGAAHGAVPVGKVGQSAAHRMNPAVADDPAVAVPA